MANEIFQGSNNQLVFSLQGANLLKEKNNCIESSTAIGYAVEEYLVSKLVNYSGNLKNALSIQRSSSATTQDSFDCYFYENGIKFLVNIKAEKEGGANDAIAAIKQLREDYCDSDEQKSYIVLKAIYKIADANPLNNISDRCIEIIDVESGSYCLEEVNMAGEDGDFQQDNRNWKAGSNNFNNGRLKASSSFRKKHKMNEDDISFERTRQILNEIYDYNEERGKKNPE